MEATQQSEIANQRQNDSGPIDFESTGNDVLGGINLGEFDPK